MLELEEEEDYEAVVEGEEAVAETAVLEEQQKENRTYEDGTVWTEEMGEKNTPWTSEQLSIFFDFYENRGMQREKQHEELVKDCAFSTKKHVDAVKNKIRNTKNREKQRKTTPKYGQACAMKVLMEEFKTKQKKLMLEKKPFEASYPGGLKGLNQDAKQEFVSKPEKYQHLLNAQLEEAAEEGHLREEKLRRCTGKLKKLMDEFEELGVQGFTVLTTEGSFLNSESGTFVRVTSKARSVFDDPETQWKIDSIASRLQGKQFQGRTFKVACSGGSNKTAVRHAYQAVLEEKRALLKGQFKGSLFKQTSGCFGALPECIRFRPYNLPAGICKVDSSGKMTVKDMQTLVRTKDSWGIEKIPQASRLRFRRPDKPVDRFAHLNPFVNEKEGLGRPLADYDSESWIENSYYRGGKLRFAELPKQLSVSRLKKEDNMYATSWRATCEQICADSGVSLQQNDDMQLTFKELIESNRFRRIPMEQFLERFPFLKDPDTVRAVAMITWLKTRIGMNEWRIKPKETFLTGIERMKEEILTSESIPWETILGASREVAVERAVMLENMVCDRLHVFRKAGDGIFIDQKANEELCGMCFGYMQTKFGPPPDKRDCDFFTVWESGEAISSPL